MGDGPASQGDPNACAAGGGFNQSSMVYIPWFNLWNNSTKDGVYMGFDYFGNWDAQVGNLGPGDASLSVTMPNYDSPVAAGQTVTTPLAFAGVYRTDLDDMTNRVLDWQYRYMWDDTRPQYFAAVRDLGYWPVEGGIQTVFDLTDTMREIGADTYHRDAFWWANGNWDGPDWKLSSNYLAKSGMNQLIYYYAQDQVDLSTPGGPGEYVAVERREVG